MEKHWQKTAVFWHTDPSEAFLIGTKESYRTLAKLLLLTESDSEKTSSVDGVTVLWPAHDQDLTEHGLDIVLTGIGIVDSSHEVQHLVNYFRQLNVELSLTEESLPGSAKPQP